MNENLLKCSDEIIEIPLHLNSCRRFSSVYSPYHILPLTWYIPLNFYSFNAILEPEPHRFDSNNITYVQKSLG